MKWTGLVRFMPEALDLPLRWKKPCRIFVNSMSDLFHESVTDEQLDQILAVMALAQRHTFKVLTKRPERMVNYLRSAKNRVRITAVDLGREKSVAMLRLSLVNAEVCRGKLPPVTFLGTGLYQMPGWAARLRIRKRLQIALTFYSNSIKTGKLFTRWNRF